MLHLCFRSSAVQLAGVTAGQSCLRPTPLQRTWLGPLDSLAILAVQHGPEASSSYLGLFNQALIGCKTVFEVPLNGGKASGCGGPALHHSPPSLEGAYRPI